MNPNPILLVEDNEDDIELTLLAFAKAVENEVVVARDGVEALELLLPAEGAGLAASLVLLDLNMPRMDGLECLRRIRAAPATRFLPVVVMTSSDEERDMIESYELGANGYVEKPVSLGEFVEEASHLGVYWLAMNRVPSAPSALHGARAASDTT